MGSQNNQTDQNLDKHFVFAALGIGVGYALILVVFSKLAGEESASVAAVALTALATGIFRRFENLRFQERPDADLNVVEVSRVGFWYVLLLLFFFSGFQVVFGTLFAALLWSQAAVDWFLATAWAQVLLVVLSYFLGGFMVGRISRQRRYFHVVMAAFCAHLLNVGIELVNWYQVNDWGTPPALSGILILPAYLVAAAIGMRTGFPRDRRLGN